MKYLIRYNKPNIFKIGSVRFFPGLNEISIGGWDEIKSHPLLKIRFESGELAWVPGKSPENFEVDQADDVTFKQEVQEDGEKKELDVDFVLATCGAKKAKQLVSETLDIDLLNDWLAKETRETVKKAILDQIKFMTEMPEKKD